ncbi:MAG: undecaprenyl-diphosphate phosphatase [Clostridia bacterium]|jgi:undecaprenyl-diphosphatase|nr:undecaprenyl-diphosphate phosphatase [Clostridia bacterium]
MDYWTAIWQSFVLGAVQGLTEFLPVSSSGHLTLLQKILGYDIGGGSMMFVNVMLHLGTLLAVIFVFRKDILALFKKPFKTLLMLIVATIPAGVIGLLFNDKIDALFQGENALFVLAIFFSVTAALLLICELVALRTKNPRELGWKNAVPMGLMQAVALFPGISRSGSTIVAGTLTRAKPNDVAKFSFLMSIPVILGSALVEIKGVVFDHPETITAMGWAGAVGILVGIVSSAVFGLLAIKLMLKVIGKANYKWFAVYLVLLSLTCVWLQAAQILPA